jgi:carboxylesterase
VLEGAEPFSAAGGPEGVLVLHGFTGNPQSMRPLAEAMADAGFTVELPLLPGHGTSIEDMVTTRWADWSAAAERAYEELAARCSAVVVAGLSMGGTLTLWLAERHPEIAGIVLVNPLAEPPGDDVRDMLTATLESGTELAPGIGSDIAKEGTVELAYAELPLAAVLSLFEAAEDVAVDLAQVGCPVLLLSSRQDHVVEPGSGDLVAGTVSGPVERVWLERSYHVATLDYDQDEIESRALAFARSVSGRAPA